MGSPQATKVFDTQRDGHMAGTPTRPGDEAVGG
ncbi:hypothetical protein [Candidatus Palauibacter sp.]